MLYKGCTAHINLKFCRIYSLVFDIIYWFFPVGVSRKLPTCVSYSWMQRHTSLSRMCQSHMLKRLRCLSIYKTKRSQWVALNKGVEGPAETGPMLVILPTKQLPAFAPEMESHTSQTRPFFNSGSELWNTLFREAGGRGARPPLHCFPH